MLTASRAGPAAMPTASNRAAWRGPEEGMGGGEEGRSEGTERKGHDVQIERGGARRGSVPSG